MICLRSFHTSLAGKARAKENHAALLMLLYGIWPKKHPFGMVCRATARLSGSDIVGLRRADPAPDH
jgi:hypothetical protein